jgi:hypothetical protein
LPTAVRPINEALRGIASCFAQQRESYARPSRNSGSAARIAWIAVVKPEFGSAVMVGSSLAYLTRYRSDMQNDEVLEKMMPIEG